MTNRAEPRFICERNCDETEKIDTRLSWRVIMLTCVRTRFSRLPRSHGVATRRTRTLSRAVQPR
eukprot:3584747-Prymnesium_polylepis.1